MEETKLCKKCGGIKPISGYDIDRGRIIPVCKQCKREGHRLWVLRNPERPKELTKLWREKNPERQKRNTKMWVEQNKDKQKEYLKEWREKHPDKNIEYSRRRTLKKKNIPKDRLSDNMSCLISYSLKHNGSKKLRHWESLVDYTVTQLKNHLEKRFLPGMSWENRSAWHIDHKIPIAAFNFTCPEDIDFKKCWCLKNLQPLWAKDNIKKSDKLENPFQPSLLI